LDGDAHSGCYEGVQEVPAAQRGTPAAAQVS